METPVEISYAGVVVGRADQVRRLDGEAQGFFLSLIDPMPVGTVLALSGNMNARVEKVVDTTDASYAGMYIRVLAAGEDPATLPYPYYESPPIPEPVRAAAGTESGRIQVTGAPRRPAAETPSEALRRAARGVAEGPIVVTAPPSAQAPLVTSGTIVGEISSARRAPATPVPAVETAPPVAPASAREAVPEPIPETPSAQRRATLMYSAPASPADELRSPEPLIRGGGGAAPELPPSDAPRAAETNAVVSGAFAGEPSVTEVADERSGPVVTDDVGELPPAKPLPADARRRNTRRRKTIK